MSEGALQACLGFFTVYGLLLLARANGDVRRELRAWVVTLLGQAFWLASTWIASQWGMFLVSVIYTAIAIDAVRLRRRRLRVWSSR